MQSRVWGENEIRKEIPNDVLNADSLNYMEIKVVVTCDKKSN